MSEHDEQCAVVKWFKLTYPKYKECIISSENGATLAGTKMQRFAKIARAKKAGMKIGVSDLFIAVPNKNHHGLWIEMKDKGMTACKVSEPQRNHIELMRKMGYEAAWCPGFDRARIEIEYYMRFI